METVTVEAVEPAAPAVLTPPQGSMILNPPPTVGTTANGKKLVFAIPKGENQEPLEVELGSVQEVREYIHNCLAHGHITEEKHQELCDEIARYSSLDQSDPRAYWFQFNGPAPKLRCPLIYGAPAAANTNQA